MKHKLVILSLVMFCLAGFSGRGQTNESEVFTMEEDAWQKVSTAHRLSQFPKIHEDGRLWFRFEAPLTAQTVKLRYNGEEHEMTQDAEGRWNAVITDSEPGFQAYHFDVDGVSIRDPGVQPFFVNGYVSAVDYPAPEDDYYLLKPVPHGDVREHWFYSEVTGSWRRMFVYTPPGYEKNPDTRYPVLYLQHGGGELESEWVHAGRANFILDNLIATGKARPMMIVMNLGFVTRANQGDAPPVRGYQPGYAAAFEEMLLNEVIPDIDATYRTMADSEHRAMAGLSMGGGQTFSIGLGNPDVFGSVGVFSSGLFGGISGPGMGGRRPFDAEAQIPGLLTEARSFNEALDLFYICVGEQDPRIEPTKRAVATLRENGLEVEFASFPGGHEWQVWRRSLHDFAQRLFK